MGETGWMMRGNVAGGRNSKFLETNSIFVKLKLIWPHRILGVKHGMGELRSRNEQQTDHKEP